MHLCSLLPTFCIHTPSLPSLLLQTFALAEGLLSQARKRLKTGEATTSTTPDPSPPVLTRAMAAVLQKDGVSILELLRRFAASDLERTMFGLCTMANQVCSADDADDYASLHSTFTSHANCSRFAAFICISRLQRSLQQCTCRSFSSALNLATSAAERRGASRTR
jgi:hypothetical protein